MLFLRNVKLWTASHACRVRHRTTIRCSALTKQKSYYEVLGVPDTATNEEIRTAYRSLAKTLHPDVSQDDDAAEVFAEINQAYAVLSDLQERGSYDYLWKLEQERRDAGYAGDMGEPLTVEEAERAAALDRLEAAHREAQRARRLATEARKAAERTKRAAAAQAREARRQAAAAAEAAAADTGPAANEAGPSSAHPGDAAASEPPAAQDCAAAAADARSGKGPGARAAARREAKAAAQAAKKQAREARRHAAQVRYWAQWAEHEAQVVRRAAGLEPLPSSPELLWEWQQQRQQRQQRRNGGRDSDSAVGSEAWEPPAPPPE